MKTFSFSMLMSALLVTLTACSSFDTPKKRTAAHKATTTKETTATPPPSSACVSCGAAGSLATIDTSAGDTGTGQKK